jgi:hypothetical protein
MGCPIIPGCWRSASSIDLLRLEIECQLLPQSARFWRAKSLNAHCFARLFWEPSKLMTRVRFPSPAPTFARSALRSASRACAGSNRGGLAARVSDGRRGLALASTKGHEKFSRGAAAAPRSVAQWLEHRSPNSASAVMARTFLRYFFRIFRHILNLRVPPGAEPLCPVLSDFGSKNGSSQFELEAWLSSPRLPHST